MTHRGVYKGLGGVQGSRGAQGSGGCTRVQGVYKGPGGVQGFWYTSCPRELLFLSRLSRLSSSTLANSSCGAPGGPFHLLQLCPTILLVIAFLATLIALKGVFIIFIVYIIPVIVILKPFFTLLDMSSFTKAQPSLALSGWDLPSSLLVWSGISRHSLLQLFVCVWLQLPHPVL